MIIKNRNTGCVNTDDIVLPPVFTRSIESAIRKAVEDYTTDAVPPELDKAKTVLFTSRWNGEEYPFDEETLQIKVAEEANWLLGMGCDTMIVNTGTRYGMAALRELSSIKKKKPIFRLIGAKIRGERFSNANVQEAILLTNCEILVYANDEEHYQKMILSRVCYVSDETGINDVSSLY